ncbi:MAG: FkbM family methyltransferase [Ignavibacteriae bacterium]|nr:MAG: FkbM family methyltransferase [Ignavibacteriota bacterium]
MKQFAKETIQYFLQTILGLKRYLLVFSIFKIFTLKWDYWEKDIFHFMDLLPGNSTILDIGANIGIITTVFSKRFKKGRIFSFEPIKENFDILTNIIKIFRLKNVTAYNVALGDETKTIKMIMPIINKVKKQGLCHIQNSENDSSEGIEYTVELKELDKLREFQNITIDAIKLDVEDYEYFVLKGGKKLIQKDKPLIFCEIHDNEKKAEILYLLSDLGYEAMAFEENNLIKIEEGSYNKFNYVFVSTLKN